MIILPVLFGLYHTIKVFMTENLLEVIWEHCISYSWAILYLNPLCTVFLLRLITSHAHLYRYPVCTWNPLPSRRCISHKICTLFALSYFGYVIIYRWVRGITIPSTEPKGRQVDSFGIYLRRWSLSSICPVNIKAATLRTFPFQWGWWRL